MLPWLGEKTAALVTLVAAPRALKHHLCSPSPQQEERLCTSQALAFLALGTPSWPQVIWEGRGRLKHRGGGEELGGSGEGGLIKARRRASSSKDLCRLRLKMHRLSGG